MRNHRHVSFARILGQLPTAVAIMHGNNKYPEISGTVKFYPTAEGILVVAEITGLPPTVDICSEQIFAFHIHEGSSCTGDKTDPFANAKTHYNPDKCRHPYHAGDLPPRNGKIEVDLPQKR